MRRTLFFLIITTALFGLVIQSQASPRKRLDKTTNTCRILNFYSAGFNSDGARIWKNSCKTCHYRGNDKGAKFLHTESKTMKGWDRVFYKRHVKCARDGSWGSLEQEDILVLNDYLYMNAANTYDPNDAEDCG